MPIYRHRTQLKKLINPSDKVLNELAEDGWVIQSQEAKVVVKEQWTIIQGDNIRQTDVTETFWFFIMTKTQWIEATDAEPATT